MQTEYILFNEFVQYMVLENKIDYTQSNVILNKYIDGEKIADIIAIYKLKTAYESYKKMKEIENQDNEYKMVQIKDIEKKINRMKKQNMLLESKIEELNIVYESRKSHYLLYPENERLKEKMVHAEKYVIEMQEKNDKLNLEIKKNIEEKNKISRILNKI
jgi:predicted RNase H-like nuclease (RuvC/YqgF family)